MIKQVIKLIDYDWKVYVYYNISKENINEIVNILNKYDFPKSYISSAYAILSKNKLNQGFTYSNFNKHISIIGITNTTKTKQFINSFVHEIHHLVSHICSIYNLDSTSEEVCYIAGNIAEVMYEKSNKLFCDCCKNH